MGSNFLAPEMDIASAVWRPWGQGVEQAEQG